jgi:hypothetical protein
MTWKTARNVCIVFIILHTIYVGGVFWYIHNHQKPQDYLYWSKFIGFADKPMTNVGFAIDRKINALSSLTYWWYNKGFSGHNLRHGVIHLVFGGLQWGIIGFVYGMIKSVLKSRKKVPQFGRSRNFQEEIDEAYRTLHHRGAPGSASEAKLRFISGVQMPDRRRALRSGEPLPAKSRFFETESGGFVVEEGGTHYILKVRICEAIPEESTVKIEYENPLDQKKPFVYQQVLSPEVEDFIFTSPIAIGGIKEEVTYNIKLSVFNRSSGKEPVDVLEQEIRVNMAS